MPVLLLVATSAMLILHEIVLRRPVVDANHAGRLVRDSAAAPGDR
jgi:hypothetical protein